MRRKNPATAVRKRKRNPAAEAAQAYKDFHGRESAETVTVRKQIHYHRHLASAGDLKYLAIVTTDGRYKVTLKKFGAALLAFNEKKNQLYIEGGNQSVPLSQFGIKESEAHELETLGRSVDIGYFTTKDHLGEDGGTATYDHKFRTTNENGRHVVVKIAKYPDVIYDVPNEQLMFSGGSYVILDEGIDK
jgi:hypothetical protein